jgi:hypothetical protein
MDKPLEPIASSIRLSVLNIKKIQRYTSPVKNTANNITAPTTGASESPEIVGV